MYLVKKYIFSVVFALLSLLIIRKLINKKSSKSIIYKIILISIYTFIIFLSNFVTDMPLSIILIFLGLIFIIKKLYILKFSTSISCSIIILILFTIPKLIDYFELSSTINNSLKELIVLLLGYIIFQIPIIKNFFRKLISKTEENNIEIISLIFLISTFTFIYCVIFFNRNIAVNRMILMILVIILCVLYIIHVYDKINYSNLIKKYNSLLDYANSYEEELERDCLIRHEHKNQLAVIKGMVNDKKVIDYINEIIKSYKDEENIFIKGLNILPNGGLRGLIYYKICTMRRKEIKYSLDISKNIKKHLLDIKSDQKKILTYIIGIFLDNSIEECEQVKDSNISIEIYYINKKINIVITNTLKNKIKLNKLGEKGYSRKGSNRGKGIYLIKKLLKKNKEISVTTKIINNYFVQEIKIDTNM